MAAVLTPKEAAVELWDTKDTPVVDHSGNLKRTYKNRIYQWINTGALRSVKVGNRYFIPRSAIEEL